MDVNRQISTGRRPASVNFRVPSSSHKFPTRVSYRQFYVVGLTKMLAI
jgi:hypothetical protein